MKYHKNQDVGLFDKENTLQELLKNGNPLSKLKEIIDFERFHMCRLVQIKKYQPNLIAMQ